MTLKAFSGPLNPYFILGVAIALPGMGHALCGAWRRALTLQMFMIAGACITWQLSTPDTSFVGRLAGGIFVYALSIPEAYRLAKLRAVMSAAGS